MKRVLSALRLGVVLVAVLASATVHAKAAATAEANLSFANRDIVTLRATSQGATPEVRAKRIHDRLGALTQGDLIKPITRNPVTIDNHQAVTFSIGDRFIFALHEGDLDPEEDLDLKTAADLAERRLKAALAASVEQTHGPVLLKGIGMSLLATVVGVGLLWLIRKATEFLLERLQGRIHSARSDTRWRWAEHAWLLVKRMAQLFVAFLWISVAYLWITFVLAAFPLTEPFADKLSGFLFDLLDTLGKGAIAAIPGLVTVAVIIFLTKAANDVVANVFENINQGRTVIPGIHKDTARATRLLFAVLIWGFGVAVAYPYLPLADSDAFRGLSVMFGFMLTLGSAGIVTQMMGGLVLIYSRALKVGDFVSIGEVMGVVKEAGVLSTKIINMRNEEVTIPNAVLVGSPIKNFTGATGERGALISTTVTIGYDTPWRQVHAMLTSAAEKTGGLRATPKPFVMQKGLQDFYVEYELYAYIDRPLERVQTLSELHSHIQDEFNTWGVQIMSPHFVLQPRKDVVIAKENWFAEPADKA